MTRRTPATTFCLVFLSLASIGTAQSTSPNTEVAAALNLLEEGRTLLDDNLLSQARDVLTRLAQQHPDNATNFFQLARADRYRVEAYSIHRDNKNAERALDEAIANIQQSLKVNEKSAEAHSLLADLYGRKISFGIAMFAGPKYGPKIQAEDQRALELDPNNAAAFASRGRQFLESPKMFGGDLDRAVADFRKATQLDPKSDETFVWLAIALRKKGDDAAADAAVREALRLNPRSVFANHAKR